MSHRIWFPATRRRELRLAPAAVTDRVFLLPFEIKPSGLTFRVVKRSRSDRTPAVLGIRLDRFDYQIQFVGTVDLARDAVVGVWLHGVGFGEIMQAINAVGGMVEHHEDRARTVFRPRKQGEMVGAEVEHEEKVKGGAPEALPPHRQRR